MVPAIMDYDKQGTWDRVMTQKNVKGPNVNLIIFSTSYYQQNYLVFTCCAREAAKGPPIRIAHQEVRRTSHHEDASML